MKQQINLYQPERPVQRSIVNATSIAALLAFLLVSLTGLSLWERQQLQQQQADLKGLEQQRLKLQQQFEHISTTQFDVEIDTRLEQQVAMLNQAITAAKQRQQWLSHIPPNEIIWTPLLEQLLAAQSPEVRLTGIRVLAESGTIEFSGQTPQPERISQFLLQVTTPTTASSSLNIATEQLQITRQAGSFHFTSQVRVQRDALEVTP